MSFAPVVDAGSFAALRSAAARGDPSALEEAAVQFEALFVGMLLKSARSASLGDGLLDGGDTRQYLELMDQQVALDVARRGELGFGRMLVEQLGGAQAAAPAAPSGNAFPVPERSAVAHARSTPGAGASPLAAYAASALRATPSTGARSAAADSAHAAKSPQAAGHATARLDRTDEARDHFVRALLPHAERAAKRLGVDPKLLVAQAALETGWGASIPRLADGRSTNNLFGMKAGASWRGPRAGAWTLEIVDGVPERRRADFRAYESLAESFSDYANVIERLPRYAEARDGAADAEAYARALAEAGYSTDPAYAEKWLAVYRSAPIAEASVTGVAHAAQERPAAADNDRATATHDGSSAGGAGAAADQDPSRFHGLTARMD